MRGKRKDLNQIIIERSLSKIPGLSYFDTSGIGNGFPDLVIGYRHKNFLFEIKNDQMPMSKKKLTPAEQIFFDNWKGKAYIVESISDICFHIGIIY